LIGFLTLNLKPNFPLHRPVQTTAGAPVSRLDATYGKLPLSFEANQGQTDRAVKFLSRGRGYALFLTGDEAVLTFERASQKAKGKTQKAKVKAGVAPAFRACPEPCEGSADARVAQHPLFGAAVLPEPLTLAIPTEKPENRVEKPRDRRAGPALPSSSRLAGSGESSAVLRLRLVGANAGAAVVGAEELPGKANYFLGNDPKKWRTNVLTYAQVKYRDVYPGVDLVYYGSQGGQLEYDFVVAPGADPSVILLDVAAGLSRHPSGKNGGVKPPLHVAANGDLVVETDGGDLRFHKPIVYQPELASNVYSSGSSQVTRHSPLVEGHYVLTASNQIRFALGAYDHSKPIVIDPVLSYSTYLGGSQPDAGQGIAVDSAGNAYVTGWTYSSDFPLSGPLQGTYGGGPLTSNAGGDAFVAKLNATGTILMYSTFLGGSGDDIAYAIAVDSAGNAYVTGSTNSTDFPTANPLQTTNKAPDGTAFVAMLNAAGSALVYSTYLGGSNYDSGAGIAVDSSGSTYVTGGTQSTDFPVVNPLQATLNGANNAFVAKLNPGGSALVYSTYLGGSGNPGNSASGIAVDSSGNAYVTGYTYSTDFPTVNPLQANYAGGSDAFVAKLNAAGSALVYSTYLGGSEQDEGNGIAVDSSGNAYVTGTTQSLNFPTVNAVQPTYGGGYGNAFLAKLNATGSALVYSTYLGGSNVYLGNGIAVDSSGNAYVTGATGYASTNPPIQDASLAAFVVKLNAAGSAILYSTVWGGPAVQNLYGFGVQGFGIAADSGGNAYVTGETGSTDFPPVTTAGWGPSLLASDCYGALISYPCPDAFVAKLSPASSASLSGGSLSFGSLPVNATSPTQSVTLTAGGDASLNLTSITASGGFALATTATSCPYGGGAIAFQSTCTIDVTFTPTATGNFTGTVTITDNAPGSPQTIALTGTGIVSAPTVSPLSLTFSSQLTGTTSASQPVTVTNNGAVPLNISSLAISSGWTQSSNCLPFVAANGSCTINVSFQPTSNGPLTGVLTLSDYAANSPQTITLSGTGLAPVVSLSPTSLTFAGQSVSTSSASQPITLTNTGTGMLTPLVIAASGDFSQTNNCPAPIAPNAGCTINVTFTPTAIGSRTGALTLTDNAPSSPQTVNLSGTGNGATATLSASTMTFGNQPVGPNSASSGQVTLQNNGNTALSITSMTLGGSNPGDFSLGPPCGNSVAAGSSCAITVIFDATARGTRSATLSIVDNAADSPQTISITGTGIGPTANLSPGSLTFPGQFVGTSGLPQNITLSNNGELPLTITSIQSSSAQFGTSNGCTSSLAEGVNCTISVFFDPSAAGTQTGTLTLTDSAVGSPQIIPLSGAGMDFAMSSSTTSDTVSAGQTATYALTVAPEGGLNQTVSLACSGAPLLATCTVPSSVTLNGTTSTPVTVSVSTTAGTMAPPWGNVGPRHGMPPRELERMLWPYALLMLASLAALAGARKRRTAYLLAFSLVVIMLWSACGGGGQVVHTPGTPTGTYALSVTATVTSTAASTRLTHTMSLTLNVN
jgi:hypothetical protein